MISWVAAWLAACAGSPSDHDHDHAAAEDPRPGQSVTVYADGLELFMEWPTFVVGQPSPLVSHFTDARRADGFVWITAGAVTATLTYADGAVDVFTVDHLLRNGIFKPIVTPTRAGPATLTLQLAGEVSGTMPVGAVQVYSDVAAATAVQEEAPLEPTVAFLKESQWKTIYATAPVERRTMRGSVRATGELNAPAGGRTVVGSPTLGRVEGTTLWRVGAQVQPGDLLARVVGLAAEDRASVQDALANAEVALSLAQQATTRADALFPAVISAKERDAAHAALNLAEQRLAALQGRGRVWAGAAGPGAEVRATAAGTVAFVHVASGSTVAAGTALLETVQSDRLWLTARVFEAHATAARTASGAMFTVPGRAEPVVVDAAHGGALLAVAPAIDPVDRTVSVLFDLPNPGDLWPGAFVDVSVFTAERRDVLAVPATALVDDGGLPVVYVMDGGESFFKRRVTPGVRDGDWVEVLAGVAPGERVVSRGAYEVLLATSAGGIPAHGHQH